MTEFRKHKSCFIVRAAAEQTEFSIGLDCGADLMMRLICVTALPLQIGRTILGKILFAPGGRLLFNSKALSCGHHNF